MDISQNRQRIALPGFARQDAIVTRQIVFPPTGTTVQQWFENFRTRFEQALDRHEWLPIYRASHGEFSFVSGRREIPAVGAGFLRYCLSRIYRVVRFQSTFYSSGTPGHGYETYKQWELPRLRRALARYVKMIGDEGVICYYFSDRDTFPLREQQRFAEWVARAGSALRPENYGHIYFVYALFQGEKWQRYFRGRKVLVISSDQPERTAAWRKVLLEIGVVECRFVAISGSHSMRDHVEVPRDFQPDLCIIGAGVGAANVLWQLRGMKCPCVDAGFVLDTLAFPHKKKQRIYCINDQEWDAYYGPQAPVWAAKFDDRHSMFRDVRAGEWHG